MAKQANTVADLGFEAHLWSAADKLSGNIKPSDQKHAALSLIFLKYISDDFEAKRTTLPNHEEITDQETVTVHLPEQNILNVETLRKLMAQSRVGEL